MRLAVVKRTHHRDPCKHRIAAVLGDKQQHLGGQLPLRRILIGLRQRGDELRGVAQGAELNLHVL